jgi:hypothetical protein
VINRSLTKLGALAAPPASLDPALTPLYGALQRRETRERTLEVKLAAPVIRIDEALLGERSPLACSEAAVAPCVRVVVAISRSRTSGAWKRRRRDEAFF